MEEVVKRSEIRLGADRGGCSNVFLRATVARGHAGFGDGLYTACKSGLAGQGCIGALWACQVVCTLPNLLHSGAAAYDGRNCVFLIGIEVRLVRESYSTYYSDWCDDW